MTEVVSNAVYFFMKSQNSYKQKILLMSNSWYPIQNLTYTWQVDRSSDKIASDLQNMWRTPSYRCYLNFTNTNENDFNLDWLLRETKWEFNYAEKDLAEMKLEVSSFLKGAELEKTVKGKRALPIATAVAGAVGLFGTGLMLGASDDCGIMALFGSSQEKANTNAQNIEKLGANAIKLGDNLQQLANSTAQKFFRVAKDPAILHEIQNKIIETKNENGRRLRLNSKYSEKLFMRCETVINSYIRDKSISILTQYPPSFPSFTATSNLTAQHYSLSRWI